MAPDLKIHNQLTTSLYFFPWIALERACGAQLLETRGSLNVNLPACCFIKQLSAHSSIHVLTFVWQRGTVKFWPKLSGGGNTACQRTLLSFETIHRSIHAVELKALTSEPHILAVFLPSTWMPAWAITKPKQHVWQSGCLPSDWLGSVPSFTLGFSNRAAHLWLAPLWYLIHQWQFVYPSTDRAVPSRTSIHAYWLCLFLVQNPYTAVELSFQWGVHPFSSLFPPHLHLLRLPSSHPPSLFWQTVLFYPVISCSPIHPFLPGGLFMLGLAANTSLTPS